MRGVMLFAAGLFAGLALQVMIARNTSSGVVMMNHVGIRVPNIAEAVTYYTQKIEYREAFRANEAKGAAAAGLHADQQEHISRAQRGLTVTDTNVRLQGRPPHPSLTNHFWNKPE
jgi:catechol 2,3-dioxygenase-like lactoylglutathione lyase family enzyme